MRRARPLAFSFLRIQAVRAKLQWPLSQESRAMLWHTLGQIVLRTVMRFYAELNDFLPADLQQRCFEHSFQGRVSIKDAIESLGVPHPEVDLIVANRESVGFSYLLQEGDRISIFPRFRSLDIAPILRVRPEPLKAIRFIVDTHLGRLARYLRMLGFDSLYHNHFEDDSLARLSSEQSRILLTRDRGLLKRSVVSHGYCVRATVPRHQLDEVVARFDLAAKVRPFRRCIRCNHELEDVSKEDVQPYLPPRTARHYEAFRRCRGCHQVYWKGSHHARMMQLVARYQAAPYAAGDRFEGQSETRKAWDM